MASTVVSALNFNDALQTIIRTIVWKNAYAAAEAEDSSYYYEIDKYIAAAKYLNSRVSTSYINSVLNEHADDTDKEWDDFCNTAFSTYTDGDEIKKRFTIMHNYVEHNNYYRMLFGLPNYGAGVNYNIYPDGYYNTRRDVMLNCKYLIDVETADIILSGEEYGEGSNPNQAMWEYNLSPEDFATAEEYQKAYEKYLDSYIYVRSTNSLFQIADPTKMSRRNKDNVDSFGNAVPDGVKEILPSRIPLHEWHYRDRTIYIASDDFAKVKEAHKGKEGFEYLDYMSEKKIWPYDARMAEKYQLLYVAPSDPEVMTDTFKQVYENCRMYMLRVFYTEAFSTNQSGYYEGFIGMAILFMTLGQMYSKYLDADIDREFFDLESLRVVYEAYSVPFYNNIPITYHKRIVKKINKLIKYKGCAQVFFDLCDIFDYDILGIYQYYLVKERKYYGNGVPVTAYTPKLDAGGNVEYDPYGNPVLTYDYDKMFNFYFLKCNINDDPFPQLLDDNNLTDYDLIAVPDKYWFDQDPDTIKRLTEEEYNYIETKYIGVQVMFSITEMLYESCYFMHMILDNKEISSQHLTIQNARHNMTINLFDFIVYIFAMICRKNGFEGTIPSDPEDVARIYGWNFKGLFKKLQEKSLQGFCIEKDFNDTSTIAEIDPLTKKLIIEELGNTGYGIRAVKKGVVTGVTATSIHVQYEATEIDPVEDVEYSLVRDTFTMQTDLNPGVGFEEGDLLAYSNATNLVWHGKVIQPGDLSNWMTVNTFLQKSEEGKAAYAQVVELINKTNFDSARSFKDVDAVYHAMLDCMNIIENRMISTHDRDEYNAWSHLRRIVETTEHLHETFVMNDGTTAPTYEDLLRDRAPDLWLLLQDYGEFELGEELDYCLAQLRQICDDLKYVEYLDSIDVKVITEYLYKLLRFFKSAKVDLMDFNIIFKIDSRTENMIKFLDKCWLSETKIWIDEDFTRWLMTDGIYHTTEKQKIHDRVHELDFVDKLKLMAEKRFIFDAPHSLPQSGQSFTFTEAEWNALMENENYSQWIPFYTDAAIASDGHVSISATHDSIGDTLCYYIDNRWLTYDVTQIRFYEKHFPRNEGESDQDYLRRVQAKIKETSDAITNAGMTPIKKTDQYSCYEMSGFSYVDEYDDIQNTTQDNPLVIDHKEKIRVDFAAIRNSSDTENYNLYLHIVDNGIEKYTIRIPAGNSVISLNHMIPGGSKVSYYITGLNGETIDILLKYSYVWTSAFRTEVHHHYTMHVDDDLSYTLSNDYLTENFVSTKAKSNLHLRDQLIQVV